jgi:long-chain acyl-CoA synthetase
VIDKYNATLGNHEQVKRFRLVPEVWSAENRFLTPTLKIKRNNITAFYKKEIEELFV